MKNQNNDVAIKKDTLKYEVNDTQGSNDETKYIFRPYRTLPDGRVIWARQYGKKAFKIPVV